jgi:hypothetical protein
MHFISLIGVYLAYRTHAIITCFLLQTALEYYGLVIFTQNANLLHKTLSTKVPSHKINWSGSQDFQHLDN